MTYPSETKVLAFHESGHALAAWRLGACLQYATIEEGPTKHGLPALGHISYGWPDRSSLPDDFPQKVSLILCAGPAAQKRHARTSDVLVDAASDYGELHDIAVIACRNPRSVSPFKKWAKNEAWALVQADWHCIEALAASLLIHRRIDGAEAIAIMERADTDRRSFVQSLNRHPRFGLIS